MKAALASLALVVACGSLFGYSSQPAKETVKKGAAGTSQQCPPCPDCDPLITEVQAEREACEKKRINSSRPLRVKTKVVRVPVPVQSPSTCGEAPEIEDVKGVPVGKDLLCFDPSQQATLAANLLKYEAFVNRCGQ